MLGFKPVQAERPVDNLPFLFQQFVQILQYCRAQLYYTFGDDRRDGA